MHVVATAGHVDHGKSTLVQALTGTDPDRWAEEKVRGMTIDLGFATTTLPSGRPIAFVDVPGHVRFLKNMLAGAGAVDACLFVVDAAEGWKPQSQEHLRILELLGISHGVVALTKIATEAGLMREGASRAQLAGATAGSFLADAEVIGTDAPAGTGVVELSAALDRMLASTPTAPDRGRPRLWVDRVFPAPGAGTVMTGTLAGGSLSVGREVELHPPPGNVRAFRARIRGLQTHHRNREEVGPGHRLAVNLVGVDHRRIRRGHGVVASGQWEATDSFDATLTVLGSLRHPVGRTGSYLAYVGSGEQAVRIRILHGSAIEPGASGLVRIRLPVALPLLPGDRYVLRETGREETVGGGEVLDVAPVLPASRARPDRSVDRVVAERGWVEADLLERLTGQRRQPDVAHWVVDPGVLDAARAQLLARVDAGAGPDSALPGIDTGGLSARDRALAESDPRLRLDHGRLVRAASAGPIGAEDHPWLEALSADPFAPPPPDGVDRALLRRWVQTGVVIERDGLYFGPEAVARAAEAVGRLLRTCPDGVTASALRQELGTSRKFVLPLLALLDATGVTRRRGEVRVGGPRLPQPSDGSPPATSLSS